MTNEEDQPSRFDQIVSGLEPENRKLYAKLGHVRAETASDNQHFVLYRYEDGRPLIRDVLKFGPIEVSHDDGAWVKLMSRNGGGYIIDYTPTRLGDNEVFVWLPLTIRLKWFWPNAKHKVSRFGHTIAIRTRSRLHLREPGIDYFEAASHFMREFGRQSLTL